MQSGIRRKAKRQRKEKVERSSGNVFADLDIPNPDEALTKAELAQRISYLLTQRKLTQKRAAVLLGIDQPKISNLVRGKLDGFSTDRLLRFVNALGQDVEIVIRPSRAKHASTRVLTEHRPSA